MLGGDTCTRHCGFCAVNKGKPMELDPLEPTHVAEAVAHLDFAHAVITASIATICPTAVQCTGRKRF